MKKFLIVFSIFSCGYLFNDVCQKLGVTFIEQAQAAYYEKSDIKKIIESCRIVGGSIIDGTVKGYVDEYGDVKGYLSYGRVIGQDITC